MSKRTLTESNTMLIGALVSVSGTVAIFKYNDKTSEIRIKRYMLMPVWIAGVHYDHLWVQSCDKIDHFKNGDKVSFTAKLNTYELNDQSRIAVKFPYENISPPKPTYTGDYRLMNRPSPCQYMYPPVYLYNTNANTSCPRYFPTQCNVFRSESIQPRKVLKFTDLDFWGNRNSLELIGSCG